MRSLLLGLIAPTLLAGLTLQAPVLGQSNFVAASRQTEHDLGLVRSLPVDVGIRMANGRIYAIVESAILIELSWHSVRSPKYQLLVQGDDGSLVKHKPALGSSGWCPIRSVPIIWAGSTPGRCSQRKNAHRAPPCSHSCKILAFRI